MSDSTTLTRCPHCQTRFRVTEDQLSVAGGKVRCGHCMEVFNAREHTVASISGDRSPTSPERKTPAPAPAAPPASELEEEEFLFQDDPEEDATDARYTRTFSANDDFSDSFLALDKGSRFGNDADEAEDIVEVDESWAEEMLHDDEHLERKTPPAQSGTETEEGEVKQPSAEKDSHPGDLKADTAGPVPPQNPVPKPAPPPRQPEDLSFSVEADDIRYPQSGARPQPEPENKSGNEDLLRSGGRDDTPYADLRSNPVETGKSGGWGTTFLWTVGCLILIGFVASQLFYFQFDRLARYEPLRPLYASVCPLIGCELPEMIDTDQIESQKLVVRSHPDEPRALLVEALIVNKAPFEQPFPSIVLTFSNLNNDIVAQRAFKPEEYLAGDAKDMTKIPPGAPVKISLELRDPGQDAVNYSLRFVGAPRAEQ